MNTADEIRKPEKKDFAIGISNGTIDPAVALAAVAAAGFGGVEIPGEWLEDDRVDRARRAFDIGPEVVEVADIAPLAVASNVATQSPAVVDAFFEKMGRMLERAASVGARGVSMHIGGLRDISESGEEWQANIFLLKRLCYHLVDKNMRLLLPVRVPSPSSNDAMDYWTAILRESMCPNIRLKIEAHPHEPGGAAPPDGLAAPFLLMTDSACFAFEPETGNAISVALLAEWFAKLSSETFQGRLVIRPRCSSEGSFEETVEKLGAGDFFSKGGD